MRRPEAVPRARIAPMPLLPVFFDLAGKSVLVAGGGAAAAWKAELVAAAGARVRVVAVSSCPELEILAATDPARVALLYRRWRPVDLDGAALAIGAFDNEEEARDFAAAARARGIPVNTVDRPGTCDFQFGAIVNRAPVVVAVSTAGAGPSLGQAIRMRIESLLPPSLADWARAAQGLRGALSARLPEAARRAAFWRRFAEAAMRAPPGDIDVSVDALLGESTATAGKVTLIGAGPGAAEHLTLKAVRALQAADVVLFDDLVSDEVLDFARREARRICVGKRGGRASCRQDDINALMLRLAQRGRRVARLKSGDPMIFGRAGEEIAALEAAGVEVEVVPGVTAALAAAAKMKMSLTHRDHAQGVKFVTAHSRKGGLPEIDWRACADPASTLMVYMGASTAPALARRLITEGLDPATPVVVAVAVGRPNERFERLVLGDLSARRLCAADPVLIGIGRAFAAPAACGAGAAPFSRAALNPARAPARIHA